MTNLLLVSVAYALYWIVEVFHDDKLRKIHNIAVSLDRAHKARDESKELKKLSDNWHSLDWIGHAFLAVLTGYLASTSPWEIPLYATMVAAMRVLILNIGGNLIAKRSIFYVGSRGIESKFKGKEIAYYSLWFGIFAVCLFGIIKL